MYFDHDLRVPDLDEPKNDGQTIHVKSDYDSVQIMLRASQKQTPDAPLRERELLLEEKVVEYCRFATLHAGYPIQNSLSATKEFQSNDRQSTHSP